MSGNDAVRVTVRRSSYLLVLPFALACGGGESSGTEPRTTQAVKLVLATTAPASARNRLPFATPPVIQLADMSGGSVRQAGIQVTAAIQSGGGILGGTVAVTDGNGKAAFVDLQITGAAGPRTLVFTAPGLTSASLSLTLIGGVATSIAAVAGTSATGTAGTDVLVPPSVRVSDADDNPVSAVAVSFAIASGGGSLAGGTASTDANGIASVGAWRLGTSPGTNTLIATVPSLAGSPVTFVVNASPPVLVLTSVSPAIAAVAPVTGASFTARDQFGNPTPVSWMVNGVAGGTPATGVISSAGVYSAPVTIPDGDTVVVSAISTLDSSRRVTALVFFMPTITQKDYFVQFPRVVDAIRPAKTRVFLVPPSDVASVTFVERAGCSNPIPPCGGAATILTDAGNGVLTFELDPVVALTGYLPNSLHNLAGFLDYRQTGGALSRRSFGVNVRDALMPDVTATAIASDAQRTEFVLNLRVDPPLFGSGVSPSVVSRALQLLGDRFDFVAVIANVSSNNNRFYIGVRNDVSGHGPLPFDNSALYGSAGRLRGLIHFPIDGLFDPQQTLAHEIGHAWINFASDPLLRSGVPHWPLSNIANESVMGFSIPGSGAGGTFPYGLVPVGNGTYRVESRVPSGRYSPWDLYVMGLLPRDSVPPALILPSSLTISTITTGLITPATTYTIDSYIAAHGVRSPAYGAAPTEFTIATLVLSYGRLLTASELAYFNAGAVRMESTVPLPLSTGFSLGDSNPFWIATGGRARLRARIN